jgi:hypothetical protein
VRAARGGGLDALLELDAEAEARVPSPPLRVASRRLGAQLLRSAAVVWPDRALIGAYRDASAVTPRPVAFGVVAGATGLAEPETARAYLYDEASTVVAAAVRLLPIDTASALRLLASAEAELGRLAERAVAQAAEPRSIPASFAPAHELRSLRHARLEDGSLPPERALRIGIGGLVGSGKSSLVAALCRALAGELRLAVVTNDIYTSEDAAFLRRQGVLPDGRIAAVETVLPAHRDSRRHHRQPRSGRRLEAAGDLDLDPGRERR